MKSAIIADAALSKASSRKAVSSQRSIFAILMNKNSNKILFAFAAVVFLAASFFPAALSHAQSTDATALTITPPFFELNVNPGDSWSSSISVVNTNSNDIQVHAVVMGFAASDTEGHGSFIPLSDLAGDSDALANWITVSSPTVTVPRGGAADVPFTVMVPQGASPGGHYAAILIGTGSPSNVSGTSQVGVSSFISALIFVRVAGNVTESAQIQEFSTDKSSYQTPDVHFAVRVENDGNVHVRPVGVIQIYNAFGKERGEVSVNGTGTLGYVLPSSSREFDVEWQGTPSLLDIGPYTAVVSLAYGENGTKSVSQTIEFWVLPIDQILEVLLGVLIAALILVFLIKYLVRRMLAREILKYGSPEERPEPKSPKKQGTALTTPETEVLDLRGRKDK